MKKTGNTDSIELDPESKMTGLQWQHTQSPAALPRSPCEGEDEMVTAPGQQRTRYPANLQTAEENRSGTGFAPDTRRAPSQRHSAQNGHRATWTASGTKPRHTTDTRTRRHTPGNAIVSVHAALLGF